MKAAGILGVLLTAKILLLAGAPVPLTPWAPLAYLWQDVLVALLFLPIDLWARRAWPGWLLYGLVSLYAALNVPIARVTSSPLTWSMLRATRGTLADSIGHHLTAVNLLLMLLTLLPGAVLPYVTRRAGRRTAIAFAALSVPVLVLGPFAALRVETQGHQRNAITALAAGVLPRLPEAVNQTLGRQEWRESPFPGQAAEDLRRFRGAARGKSVILVILESAGARYLAPYGAAEDPMPNLSRLAERSILFENAYAVYPESIKGLYSVLLSLYPGFDVAPEVHGKTDRPSLASVLAGAGYATALFHSGRFAYLGMEEMVKGRGFGTLEDAGDIGGERKSSFGVDEPSAVRRLFSWIDGLPRGGRFFAAYLPIAGHHPYATPRPGPFPGKEEIDRYRNALHHADEALGAIVEGLQARGLLEEALLVIFGDHGEAFGQHPENFGHTFFLYEENVHVPYLLAVPGAAREQVRVRRPASLLDTAPTVLDLLGIRAPDSFQGASLLDPPPRMALFFTDYSLGFLGLRDGPWKCIHQLESGRSLLFDLSADPLEKEDLSSRHPDRADAYRRRLLDWSAFERESVQRVAQEARARG
jgi:hypothetical protein